jgi:8-hydroxy-5-deazaflavin:NADPH oxidoreductase
MRVGILGTGIVGRSIAEGFAKAGHDVAIGTRDVDALMARTEGDRMGNPPFAAWYADHDVIGVSRFAGAAAHGELVVNATRGDGSIAALTAAGEENLTGKILVDASNALDGSSGFPPTLFVANTDSLAELIQAAFPAVHVVKAWNTMTAGLMTNPAAVAGGDHSLMICGNDEAAKTAFVQIARGFGWKHIVDLGDLTGARAMEAYVTVWVRAMTALGTPMFNVKFVTGS